MKISRKLLALSLALLLILSSLFGCAPIDDPLLPEDDSQQSDLPDSDSGNADSEPEDDEPQYTDGIYIDGIKLEEYKIIIPARAELFTKYAAQNLSTYLKNEVGIRLTTYSDRTVEGEYEILIGDTAREASSVDIPLADNEYLLYRDGNKIICQGNAHMVGGGVGELISMLPTDGSAINITEIPTEPTPKVFVPKEAKNVIFMIGDGMGFNTIDMAYPRFSEGFSASVLPVYGEIRTASMNSLASPNTPTDSAASGTALATGFKTYNGRLGMDGKNKILTNLRELAHSVGANTGVVTTDAITGATPGAFLVHHSDRNGTEIIQAQIDQLVAQNKVDVVEGSVGNNLTKVTADALAQLSADDTSFFIMIEEAYIDKNSHSNAATACITAVKRFHDCIAYAIEFVLCHPDTVLIITADHETGGIRKNADGSFTYTTGSHTTSNVPIFAVGEGTEIFHGKSTDNTNIPKFLAKIFGEDNFGSEIQY